MNPRDQCEKVDSEVYTAAIEESISDINTDVDNLYGLDATVRKFNNILNEAIKAAVMRNSTENGYFG